MSDASETVRPLFRKCVFLFWAVMLYLLLGGALFKFVEEDARDEQVQEATMNLEEERAELIKGLWAETIAKAEDDWALIANERLNMYEGVLKEYTLKGIDLEDEDGPDNPWTFVGSIFYCYTVVTTIGYGNIFPTTPAGKLLTIVYATIGIPLTLIYLTEIGKLLTVAYKYLLRKKWPDYDTSEDFNFGPFIAVVITVSYLLLGVVVFDFCEEDWDLIDSAYFSFITFSSVGFGDLVPTGQGYMLLLMAYTLSALSMVSMCFCVIQSSLESLLNDKHQTISDWWQNWQDKKAAAKAKKDDDLAANVVSNEIDPDEEIEADEVEEEVEDDE